MSRFIALAKVGNKDKKKWLYAFNITPLKTCPRQELVAQPVGVTDMPFREEHISIQDTEKKAQFFFDMNAKMDEGDGRGKKRKHDEGPPKAAGPCWFCLSSAEVEKHFIVSVGTHCYLALPKGGLTDDHVLILPIGHQASQMDLTEEGEAEVAKFKSALRKMYKRQGKAPVFFERNYRQQHLQIQVVPVAKDQASDVTRVFLDTASSLELDLNEIPSHVPLSQLAVQGQVIHLHLVIAYCILHNKNVHGTTSLMSFQAYFYAEAPDKQKLFGRITGKNYPLQFGRYLFKSLMVYGLCL